MKLVIEPTYGLANRFRTIDAAISWATENDFDLIILWDRFSGVGCKLSHLVDTGQLNIIEFNGLNLFSILLARLRALISLGFGFQFAHTDDSKLLEEYLQKSQRKRTSIWVKTCVKFHEAERPYQWLKPKDKFTHRVDHISELAGIKNLVGLHIRRATM